MLAVLPNCRFSCFFDMATLRRRARCLYAWLGKGYAKAIVALLDLTSLLFPFSILLEIGCSC